MSILSRLILKEWFRAFFLATGVLVVLITTATVVSELLRGTATIGEIFLKFFFDLPLWLTQILPVACLIATLFGLNKLRNASELIVILAAGFSRRRVILTLVGASSLVALMQYGITGHLLPLSKKMAPQVLGQSASKFRLKEGPGIQTSSLEGDRIWYKSPQYFFSFAGFDFLQKELRVVGLYFFSPDYKATEVVLAEKARYLQGQEWVFEQGRVYRDLDGLRFPHYESFKERTYTIREGVDDFRQIVADISTLNIEALGRYIRKIKKLGINANEYQAFLYDKWVQVILCVLFSLVALGPLYSPNRRGASLGKNVFFTFIFILIYWFFYSSVLAFGANGKIPAWVGAFSIPACFLAYVLSTFYRHRKIST